MGKISDLSGQKFGRLTGLYKLHNYHKPKSYYLCVCDCGNLTEIMGTSLTDGSSRSCGCLIKDVHTKHCKTSTRLYRIWQAMKNRCYNKHRKSYQNYGSRGIKVCGEWLSDFVAFYNWAINNGYKENLSIDRIDNNRCYSPDNCRWTDNKTQAQNRRSNRNYTINGETHCLQKWCEIYCLDYFKVIKRLDICHWSIEQALELEERCHDKD